ncbi:TetR/AcrR family transcriptional regulator [Dokdonia sp. R86516]|uniref:TetR/AcrR family transcriptional regulator n=1 Tax=Dokdonia sp. R86516 TaxID=3093856 RepID=UPI0037C9C430
MPRSEDFDRELVLALARDLFWQKGYHGTSMSDLVDATSLNRSSIYNSFGNKKAIYKTLLIQYQEENEKIYTNALVRASNPLEGIRFIFENFIEEIVKDTQGRGCFSINCKVELSREDESIKDYLEKMQEHRIEFFKGLVQEGQDAHLINTKQSASQYAYFLFCTFQGLRTTRMFLRNRDTLQQIVSNALSVLRRDS